MKKKIFTLAFMVVMLLCLVIGINAEDAATETTVATPDISKTTVTLDDSTVLPIWDTDGDALIWYKSTANADDGYANYDYVKAQDPRVDYYANGQYSADGQSYNQVSLIKIDGSDAKSIIVVLNINDPDVKVTSAKDTATEKKCLDGPVNGFESTFKQSTSIEYVYLRTDFIAFQSNAFYQCSNLKYVNFEQLGELRSIASSAFTSCSKLFADTRLDLSNTKITTIGSNGLGSLNMTELKLPATLTTVDQYAFQYARRLTRLDLPSSITKFSNSASFRECNALETVTGFGRLLEEGIVTGFGNYMFANCYKLKNVDGLITDGVLIIPEGFTSIGSYKDDNQAYVFSNCDELLYAEMPSTLVGICRDAFNGCNKLKLVNFDKVNEKVKNQIKNGEAYTVFTFKNCSTFQNCTSLFALTIPEGTETVTNRIVLGCTSLEAVYLPSTAKIIGTNGNGQGAFDGCKKMYFVEECFTVGQCIVDGEFDFTRFVIPQKQSVYHMPQSLTGFGGHVRKEFGGTGGSEVGSVFQNCEGLNEVIVFGENFKYISSCNAFSGIGTSGSPKTVVFLANIQGAVTLQNAKYVTFMFTDDNDKSVADIGMVRIYKDSNNTDSYMYFCSTEKKYSYNNTTNSEISAADAINAFVAKLTAIDGAIHIDNPKAQGNRVVSGATCTDNEKVVDICFCKKTFNEHYVEGTALGHDNVILSLKYENGFTVDGKKHIACNRTDCDYESEAVAYAIFTGMLYATRQENDGNCGLVFTYEINLEALNEYQTIVGYELVFGALSVAQHNLNGTSPINGTDGKANQDKVVRAQLSGTGINHVDYIIRGSADAWNAVFNADTGATIKDVKFYILGYVIENGSVNYFLGENTNGDITNLSTITYNLATNK